jgi:choline dehydrogenase-like flavoprotein
VGDPVETAKGRSIAEDHISEERSIDGAIVEHDSATEGVNELAKCGLARCDHLSCHDVRIDDCRALLGQIVSNCRLSGTYSSGYCQALHAQRVATTLRYVASR